MAGAELCLRSRAGKEEQCHRAPHAHKFKCNCFVDGRGVTAVLNHLYHDCLPSMHRDSQEPTVPTSPLALFCTSQSDFTWSPISLY